MRYIWIAALALLAAPPAFAQNAAPPASVIDAAALVGPPPGAESAQAAADRLATHPRVSAERLAQAVADQDVNVWTAFAPVFGADFTEARLPRTARVLAAVRAEAGPAIGASKGAWRRDRPFVADPNVAQCLPLDESLRTQSSYPSGHSTIGFAWALTLAELAPARADAALQRGRDYGTSRIICGVHFPSDVEAGRLLAAGLIARLHADPAFRRDLDAARRELTRAYPE